MISSYKISTVFFPFSQLQFNVSDDVLGPVDCWDRYLHAGPAETF